MLYNTGTFVVTSSASDDVQTDAFGALKSAAAGEVQGQNQPFYLEEAGKFILRGIDAINMKQHFRFMRSSGSDQTIVSGTSEYSIPAGTIGVGTVQLLNTVDGKVWRNLEFVPWEQFTKLAGYQDATGKPEFWTAKNSFSAQKIRVYPEPDDTAVTYELRVTTYQRINRPVIDTDVIVAPRELSTILSTYAEAWMLKRFHKEDPRLGEIRERDYEDLLKDFMQMDRPEEDLQWVLPSSDNEQPNKPSNDPLRYM